MGKRLAVLVGCNYPNTRFRLLGCVKVVQKMSDLLLQRFAFENSDIELLTDEDSVQGSDLPTGENIKNALTRMVNQAKPGDVLFFHFSGHGTLVSSLESDQYMEHEAIVPCDLNPILGLDLRKLIIQLPPGTSFTFLSDSCNSGGLVEKDHEQIKSKKLNFGTILNGLSTADQSKPKRFLIMCEMDETTADVMQIRKAHGAFTDALLQVLRGINEDGISNKQLVKEARKILKKEEFQQHACFYCSDENVDAVFLSSSAVETDPDRYKPPPPSKSSTVEIDPNRSKPPPPLTITTVEIEPNRTSPPPSTSSTEEIDSDRSKPPPSSTSSTVEIDPDRSTQSPPSTSSTVEIDPERSKPPLPSTSSTVEIDPDRTPPPPSTSSTVEIDPDRTPPPPSTSTTVEIDPDRTTPPPSTSSTVETDPNRSKQPPPSTSSTVEIDPHKSKPPHPSTSSTVEIDPDRTPPPPSTSSTVETDPDKSTPPPPSTISNVETDPDRFMPPPPSTSSTVETDPDKSIPPPGSTKSTVETNPDRFIPPPPSTSNTIATRWKDLSGKNDWADLLNPLDNDLRRYIIHYGQSVAAVRDLFNYINENSSLEKVSERLKEIFFERACLVKGNKFKYKVTDFFYAGTNHVTSSWFGYVAVTTDEGTAVLGRRDILVAWRGTATTTDWIKEAKDQVPAPHLFGAYDTNAKVHSGFLGLYKGLGRTSVRDQVLNAVSQLVERYIQKEEISITITGFSVGAALATLNAMDIVANGGNKPISNPNKLVMVTAFVFGGPRVGNAGLEEVYKKLKSNHLHILRIENSNDIVPRLPRDITGYKHLGDKLEIDPTQSNYLKLTCTPPNERFLESELSEHFRVFPIGRIPEEEIGVPILYDRGFSFISAHNDMEVYLHGVAIKGNLQVNREHIDHDIALVNKHLNLVYKIPPNWWRGENRKRMYQKNDGRWVVN